MVTTFLIVTWYIVSFFRKESVFDDVLDLLVEANSYLHLKDRNKQSAECSLTLPLVHSGEVGRLAFEVPRGNLKLYLCYGFSF